MTVVNYSFQEHLVIMYLLGKAQDGSSKFYNRKISCSLRKTDSIYLHHTFLNTNSSWNCYCLTMPKKGWGVPVCLILMSMPLLIPWNVVGAMWNIFALPDIGFLGHSLNAMVLTITLLNNLVTLGLQLF